MLSTKSEFHIVIRQLTIPADNYRTNPMIRYNDQIRYRNFYRPIPISGFLSAN